MELETDFLKPDESGHLPEGEKTIKHHVLIAGTGRAGTSFLVKFLHACGAETHLSRHEHGWWDDNANAGLEDFPGYDSDLPYVIKTPWFFEFAASLLKRTDIALDAVIIPVRDLVEAASSRTIVELSARYASGALADDENTWETWCLTPGGIVYSVNPLDQARILAMGFHEVIRALVRHDIPIVFLDFPRFVEDAEYAYSKLRPYIPADHGTALEAHAGVADLSKVRTSKEIKRQSSEPGDTTEQGSKLIDGGLKYPSVDAIDSIALRREHRRLRDALAAAGQENEALRINQAQYEAREHESVGRLAEIEAQLRLHVSESASQLTESETQLARVETLLEHARQAAAREHADAQELRRQSAIREVEARERADAMRAEIDAYKTSTSWKVTAPIRALRTLLFKS
jgi:hypothetical protein